MPDGVLEIPTYGGVGEKFFVFVVRCDLRSGDGGVGGEIGKPFGNGVVGGLEKEDAAFVW